MNRTLKIVVLSLFVFSLATWAADDSNIGTWKLNVDKSKYSPGPAPRSLIVRWEQSGNNGVKYSDDQVDAKGASTHGGYTANYDGKDYPWTGNPDADTISLKRIDANTVGITWKKAGKVTVTARRAVSKDGKTITITQKGSNAQGQPVNNVLVLDKQ